jgi:hypothetical protein
VKNKIGQRRARRIPHGECRHDDQRPAFVVAKISKPVRHAVEILRERYARRTPIAGGNSAPGSSGTGPIPAGMPVRIIPDPLQSILPSISPWTATFSDPHFFPYTSIVYLASSDVPVPTEFAVADHAACTLHAGENPAPDLAWAFRQPLPTTPFLIGTIRSEWTRKVGVRFDLPAVPGTE